MVAMEQWLDTCRRRGSVRRWTYSYAYAYAFAYANSNTIAGVAQ